MPYTVPIATNFNYFCVVVSCQDPNQENQEEFQMWPRHKTSVYC